MKPVVFMFPGLGDHYVGMGGDLYREFPVFREAVDVCAQALIGELGVDIREVIFPAAGCGDAAVAGGPVVDLRRMLAGGRGPRGEGERRLRATALAQPALFVVEYALARLWQSWGARPSLMVGYSLGEYVAATLAGVLSVGDALMLVARRAALIEELPAGAMLAVMLPEREVTALLGGQLSLSAVNGPQLCVVGGAVAAVEALETSLREGGVVCRRVQSTHAFHSSMMEPVAERVTELARSVTLKAPSIPYLSNVTGEPITDEQATDPAYWARHLLSPVRFAEGLAHLPAGALLLEAGPGQSLSSMASAVRGSDAGAIVASMRHSLQRTSDSAVALKALGRLWLAGADIDWDRFPTGALDPAAAGAAGALDPVAAGAAGALDPAAGGAAEGAAGEWDPVAAGAAGALDPAAGGAAEGAAGEWDPVAAGAAGALDPVAAGAVGEWGPVADGAAGGAAGALDTAADGAAAGAVGEWDRVAAGAGTVGREGGGSAGMVGAVERELAGVWARILNNERLARDVSFFEVGGNSLLATRLCLRIKRAFGVELTLRQVYEWSTIARMAAAVERLRAGGQLDGDAAGSSHTGTSLARIELPNALTVWHQNEAETRHFYQDIFEHRTYARNGITLREGATVVDVGGNIGLFTLFAHYEAKNVRVFAFEPAPPMVELLSRNVAEHGVNATVFDIGLSDAESQAAFTFYPRSSGMSSFHPDEAEEKHNLRTIIANQHRREADAEVAGLVADEELLDVRLEAIEFTATLRPLSAVIREQGIERIDLIKIDVQKSERQVIDGIAEQDWPKIQQMVLEVHDADGEVARLVKLLRGHGFTVCAEQDEMYVGTDIHNIYAVRG
ncbi:FkbM family methyltransferase [Streptomyces sp. AHA2]|uniref:FkbM family methyltransferase n=1 Tax=Streptomyces sp. AHA2 TaxID=3064526 RepID=UPI002FE023AA